MREERREKREEKEHTTEREKDQNINKKEI